MITFIDLFAGIGGIRRGFEKAGMKCIGYCEADKFARQSYQLIHDTDGEWFSDDITKVKASEIPKADIWTFGFPCQDISVAGKQAGLEKGKRSSLFFKVMELVNECKENKPRFLVAENVRNLLSIENGWGFYKVLREMDRAGYDVEWCTYNTKDYGIPQNRCRLFLVGFLRGTCRGKVLPIPRKSESSCKQVGNIVSTGNFNNPQWGRIYSVDGCCPTLTCVGGGDQEPKIVVPGMSDGGGTSFIDMTIGNAVLTDNARCIVSRYDRGLSDRNGLCSGVIEVKGSMEFNKSQIRIRKLTPGECWRLQGFTQDDVDRVKPFVSNTQMYKQAGNAVTVNVAEEIGKALVAKIEKIKCKHEERCE